MESMADGTTGNEQEKKRGGEGKAKQSETGTGVRARLPSKFRIQNQSVFRI